MKTKKGFTLIELLVVIGIIGLLSTFTIAAMTSARQKARDAKRVADVVQISNALEFYFSNENGYPVEAVAIVLGSANYKCLDEDGFVGSCDAGGVTYMGLVPGNITPGGTDYTYISSDGSDFTLSFTLESVVGDLDAGAHTISPAGIN